MNALEELKHMRNEAKEQRQAYEGTIQQAKRRRAVDLLAAAMSNHDYFEARERAFNDAIRVITAHAARNP